ncbi:MAG: hypothetical protein ABW095_06805 [Candidatus Thiodiazotropha sp.]
MSDTGMRVGRPGGFGLVSRVPLRCTQATVRQGTARRSPGEAARNPGESGMRLIQALMSGGRAASAWFPGFRCAAPGLQYDKAQPGVARVKQRVTRGNLARV